MKTVLIQKMAQLIWQKTAIPDIRTLTLNRVGYLRSGFVHLLPDVSGSGVRSTLYVWSLDRFLHKLNNKCISDSVHCGDILQTHILKSQYFESRHWKSEIIDEISGSLSSNYQFLQTGLYLQCSPYSATFTNLHCWRACCSWNGR